MKSLLLSTGRLSGFSRRYVIDTCPESKETGLRRFLAGLSAGRYGLVNCRHIRETLKGEKGVFRDYQVGSVPKSRIFTPPDNPLLSFKTKSYEIRKSEKGPIWIRGK
jgi:hypothetical protein